MTVPTACAGFRSRETEKATDGKEIYSMKVKNRLFIVLACFLLFFAGSACYPPVQADAASQSLNLEQIQQKFASAVKNGKHSVSFTAPANLTTAQIRYALEQGAKSQNRLLAGSVQFRKQTNSASADAKYTIELSDDAFMKITRLKSEAAAKKAAAKALKNRKYSTNYYSDISYYNIFVRMLKQHPEYNYNTVIWKNSNGAYGYHRGDGLSKKQQEEKQKAADKAAAAAASACVRSGMSAKEKAKAIHDYLIKNCAYDDSISLADKKYNDAFTAYGALVNGSAVCQGYAAAFNLMASKCGLQSMTVCGTSRGVAHAWTYIKSGDKYRYLDCTWDDAGKKPSYEYFYVDEQKMRQAHVWNALDFPAGDIKYAKYLAKL